MILIMKKTIIQMTFNLHKNLLKIMEKFQMTNNTQNLMQILPCKLR